MGISAYLTRETSAAPLRTLRAGFGLLMFLSVVRFWSYGWIEKLYLRPDFHFSYRHFEWAKPLGNWTYFLFGVVALAALGVAFLRHYRPAAVVFFLGFTYVELMDKTTYLNHYYFVSLLALLLVFLPTPRSTAAGDRVPRWAVQAVRLFVAAVYLYAGLAKLNSDWLLHAQPLAIWLPAKYDLPLLGPWLQQRWMHFAFAWSGALYDLLIPFLLLWRRTRVLGFVLVVVFHLLTRVLFPIGMFPYIMILGATIFFDGPTHERWHRRLRTWVGPVSRRLSRTVRPMAITPPVRWGTSLLRALPVALLLLFHLTFPFRYLMHPGELFWTENGFRFSWRVMLIEKAGLATFRVEDPATGRREVVDNRAHLTVFQEKQMSTQPDFILEFAHHLAGVYRERGYRAPRVYVDSYVALNGRLSQRYVDPTIDLAALDRDTPVETFLLDFNDTIHGL